MKLVLGTLFLGVLIFNKASPRQISYGKLERLQDALKRFSINDINLLPNENDRLKQTTPEKRGCMYLIGESCSNGRVPGAGADSDWIRNGGNVPGKRTWKLFDFHNLPILSGKRCVNLLDESCSNGGASGAGDDSDWINGGNSPGKRSLNVMDDHNVPFVPYSGRITPGKRCVNLLDESCSNGGASGAGDDSDWINGGNSPGKRSLNVMDDHNVPFVPYSGRITPGKRCVNLLDESCSNGGASGAGDDSDWINGGNSPGKRSLNVMDDHNVPFVPYSGRITPGKRCVNLLDESCSNGGASGAGDDSDWINGGNSPGKRSLNVMDDHNVPFVPYSGRITPGKRCVNLLDESCSNGGASGAGDDSDWINGGNSPGKRSLNVMDDHNVPFVPYSGRITPGKRCVNLLDESCSNGGASGAGDDSDWINGGNSPGKRSLDVLSNYNGNK
ncbi:uncharacterized protein LOC126893229 isoform X4 [Diabrotica virgifera virgifera]|uniref:Uncharacterized protein n=1 Tax=Diabrotica virgifera virgifera TaxID=50390 RepID=A0ABM5L9P9_DIAVI|nr:uncharacterized protein LOC126893229 isoform X4 [Diabrotica virgifera virgifera]